MSFYSVAPFIKEFYPEFYSIESYPEKLISKIHEVGLGGIETNRSKARKP